MLPVELSELAVLSRFLAEELNYFHPRNVLLIEGIDARDACPNLAVGLTNPSFEDDGYREERGQNREAYQGELPVE